MSKHVHNLAVLTHSVGLQDHPHYLVQDIDALREQLARLFPTGDPAKIISRNPDIVLQLECNTKKNQPLGKWKSHNLCDVFGRREADGDFAPSCRAQAE